MKKIINVVTLLIVGMFCPSLHAEGNCPPGQYPIGGQGVVGCAPIPQGGGGISAGPSASGKWHKTWGAIVWDRETAALGASAGMLKKQDAVEQAVTKCHSDGGKSCRDKVFTYKNQCAAIASTEESSYIISSGASEQVAKSESLNKCRLHGECKVIYVNCADPLFEKF